VYLPKGAYSSSLRSPSTTFPLTSLPSGPTRQILPLPRAGRPEARLHRASLQLIAPRLPACFIETPIKAPYSPALIPPLESPLTPPRPSMASVENRRPLPNGISTLSSPRPPIKGEHHPEFHRTSPHFFSPLSMPEQRSHRAPMPPNLHHHRPASTLLLHLG
jgi:hypothetical protein